MVYHTPSWSPALAGPLAPAESIPHCRSMPAPQILHAPAPRSESPVVALARWAARARPSLMLRLAQVGIGAAALVLVLDWRRWPAAAGLLAAGLLGVWGVVEHHAPEPHTKPVTAAEQALVLLGVVLAAAAGFGLFFWILGPAPTF